MNPRWFQDSPKRPQEELRIASRGPKNAARSHTVITPAPARATQTHRHADTETHRHKNKNEEADRETGKQAGSQTDRQTDIFTLTNEIKWWGIVACFVIF